MVNIREDCRDKYHGCYLRFASCMIARTSYVLFCKATCKNSHLPYTPKISSREYIIFLYTAFHVFSESKAQNFTANLFSSTIPSPYLFFVDAFISKIKSEADQEHFLGEGAPLRNDRTDVYYHDKKKGESSNFRAKRLFF